MPVRDQPPRGVVHRGHRARPPVRIDAPRGLVDERALKAAGAHGVVKSGNVVQVVVGPEADNLAEDIEDLM